MKNMQLSKLRKRNTNYFKKIGKVKYESKKVSDYIANKSYEALSKTLKKYVEGEKEQLIRMVSNMIAVSGDEGVDVFKAIKAHAQKTYEQVHSIQKTKLWATFRVRESSVYYKYNSYMYRLGYSASSYWFENVKFEQLEGSLVVATLTLPNKTSGIIYNTLEIIYDYSGDYFMEANMY